MITLIEQLKNEYLTYPKTDVSENFKEFEESYSIATLGKLKSEDLAKRVFGDANTYPRGLFSWIENGKRPTSCKCGAEVGGQLGIQYKPKENNQYVFYEYVIGSRTPKKNSISKDEAISLAENIVKALEYCCRIIETAETKSKEDYEETYARICQVLKEIDRPNTKEWYWSTEGKPGYFMLKYFLCSFPQKFATTYSYNSLKQVLIQLLPEDEISDIPFVMNGQLSIIERSINADCVNFENFIAEKGFYAKNGETKGNLIALKQNIWKISHGALNEAENQKALEKQVVLVGWGDDNKQGRDFSRTMKIGDWFYLTLGGGSGIKLLGKIVSDVENSQIKDGWRERKYQLVCYALNSTPYPANHKKMWEPTGQSTCFEVKKENFELFETRILKPYFDMHLSDLIGSHIDNRKDENHMDKNISDISLNTILYGPPGTGKTYNTVLYAVAICKSDEFTLDVLKEKAKTKEGYEEIRKIYNELLKQGRIAFTTFHQSYGYEDFIEGIKPIIDDNESSQTISYDVKPGVFKNFCEETNKQMGDLETFNSIWEKFIKDVENNNNEVEISLKTKSRKLVWEEVEERFYVGDYSWKGCFVYKESVQKFYFDGVVEGSGGTMRNRQASCQGIVDKLKKEYGLSSPNKETITQNKVFIIDEINRGNVSKIFGELITLIEEEKRGKSKVKLPYSQRDFAVPENVYILGTMNTADRSLALMDTALRRRFDFVEMMPDASIFTKNNSEIMVEGVSIKRLLETMNKRIEFLYDREHTIGHAYFKELLDKEKRSIETLRKIFIKKIIPLLQEYFYDDYNRIRLVLGDNQFNDNNMCFIKENEEMVDVFFGNIDIDMDAKTYTVNEYIDKFEAKRFIQIYEPLVEGE